MNIAVIGAGAAGFMAAITAKENNPTAYVTIFEKSSKMSGVTGSSVLRKKWCCIF